MMNSEATTICAICANTTLTEEIERRLLEGEVPYQWGSEEGVFLNECDAIFPSWEWQIFRAMYAVASIQTPGGSKKENKDFHLLQTTPRYNLTASLVENGYGHYNVTIRLPQIEGTKAKRRHYSVHFWAKKKGDGFLALDTMILAKLKLEGKYIPQNSEEAYSLKIETKAYAREIERLS